MFTDLILVILAIAIIVGGYHRGLIATVASVVGFVAGFVVGRVFAEPVAAWLVSFFNAEAAAPNRGTPGPVWLAPLIPLVVGLVGSALAGSVGAWMRNRLGRGLAARMDAVVGALVGVVYFVVIVWLGAAWIRTTPFIMLNQGVAQSRIVAAIDRVIPADTDVVLGSLDRALANNGLPTVFKGQPERIRGVGEPSEDMVAVGRAVSGSVVKVVTNETRCRNLSVGSGWVFRDGLVATNAHVVAGSVSTTVQIEGKGKPYAATLVAFDPDRDVAVLRVDGLPAPALDTGSDLLNGADSVVVGFPANGPYTISPTRVRETLHARGLDIYNRSPVVRDVYSLRGIVREGNSGGPLLNENGDVVGMVFAKSSTDDETGYALTLGDIESVLRSGANNAEAVASGSCTVG